MSAVGDGVKDGAGDRREVCMLQSRELQLSTKQFGNFEVGKVNASNASCTIALLL
jgi:hypothetical protein